jgi:hypothetical protein
MKHSTKFNNISPKNVILLIIIFSLFGFQKRCIAQISVDSYIGVGQTLVSEGAYGDFSTSILAKFAGFNASTGGLISLNNTQQDIFAAYSLALSKDFRVDHHDFNIGAFYLWKPFSVDFSETNVCLIADFRTRHFGYSVGLNSRVYSFTKAAKQKYNFPDSVSTSVVEPLNLMYKLSYFRPFKHFWLFEASVTNYDRYIIMQEINPMFFTKFSYKVSSKLQLYSELCYIQTGFFNVRVGYFGFSARGGLLWRLN